MEENNLNTSTSETQKHCAECNKIVGQAKSPWWFSTFATTSHQVSCSGDHCNAVLCSKCRGKYPLEVVCNTTSDDDKHGKNDKPSEEEKTEIKSYCKKCFHKYSCLDFSRSYDIIAPATNNENSSDAEEGVVFVMVHGGGGSRAMFSQHAKLLAETYGHSTVLIDLPGHGTLVETPLTLSACVDNVSNLLQKNDEIKEVVKGKSLIYVGGSLGAYTGFYTLAKMDETKLFKGAILLMCGQNVGPGSSMKARLGMIMLKYVGSHCSNEELMKLMQKEVKKSPVDFYVRETCNAAGAFFDQAEQQCECLSTVDPLKLLPDISIPILFMNGSEDHRDSEDKWLAACQSQELSYLHVYEGGDHFFSHDSRFVDDMLQRWDTFAKKVANKNSTTNA